MNEPSLYQTRAPLIRGIRNRLRYKSTVAPVRIISVTRKLLTDLLHFFDMMGVAFIKITVVMTAAVVMTSSFTTDVPFMSIRAVPVVLRNINAVAAAALWEDVTIVQKIRSSPKSIVPKVA